MQLRTFYWRGWLHIAALFVSFGVFAQNGPWTINVKNVELEDFIEEVATITGRTFVVDPRVKGAVTIISDTKLDSAGVYDLLMTVLKVHEFSMIENGNVVEVIQSARARTAGGAKAEINANTSGDTWITRVIDAGHLEPSEIVKSLRQLAPQHAQFSAIAESNAVLISDRKNNVEGMVRVVEQLKSSAAQKTVIVDLEHLASADAAKLILELHKDTGRLQLIGNDTNNSLVLRGTESVLMDTLQTIELIDKPSPNQTNTRVFRLGHSTAADVAAIVDKIVNSGRDQSGATLSEDRLQIAADESLNAVVVLANPNLMRQIASLIKDLDQRRPLVLIEAAIVEVDLADIATSGAEFGAADIDGDALPAFSTSINGVLSALLNRLGENDPTASFVNPIDVISSFSSPTLAISQLNPDGLSYGAIINALSSASYANLLSTPSVMALNNEESNILVGQSVPFRSGNLVFPNEQSLTGLRPTNRDDIGTQLKVVPSIHDDLSVRMQIDASIEVIQDTGIGIGDAGLADIVTNKREIQTVVVAENQQTIVLGGLIRNETRASDKRVPLIGRIPLLGRLFSSSSDTNTRTMLLIFLRPTVVSNREAADAITARKYQEYWEVVVGEDDVERQPLNELFKGNSD
ncbi:MAG: type II secretion system protein GspD [Gammaproteobacteria bacterium]|nr:type II secretion system protein GspD [Gammaproteobacteria bacterium]